MAMTLADSALTMTLRVRAFDDGVAFRYEWDASGRDSITVMDELTEFAFAEEATTWSIPADFDSYEKITEYCRSTAFPTPTLRLPL